MKWFKHYENAHTNQFIQALLMDKNGHKLHSIYWLLLEFLCGEFKKDTTIFTASSRQLKEALHIGQNAKVREVLAKFAETSGKFDESLLKVSETSENFWKIETPIILELMGKSFKRTRHGRGNDTPKKEEERNKNKNTQEAATAAVSDKLFDLEAPYKNYPRKIGKSKGMVKLRKAIKTPEQYENLCRAINNYALHCEKSGTEQNYIKHFSTFVSEWEDWIELPEDAVTKTEEEKIMDLMERFDSGEFDVC